MCPSNQEREKPKTLYQGVIDDIMDRIHNGAFSFEKPITTELQLMEQYGVSRITARRAMTELENQGILYRKRGVGSFVSREIYQRQPRSESTSKVFAFIFPFDVSRSGLSAAFQAANAVLMQKGYAASIYISEHDEKTRGRAFLSQLITMDIAGVAYYPMTSDIHLSLLNHLVFGGKPVVIMDVPDRSRYISSVSSDNYGGACKLMEHLIGLGHKRIGYLTGVALDARPTITDRFSGYVLALEGAGIRVDESLIVTSLTEAHRRSAGEGGLPTQMHQTIQRLVARGATAFVCEHDQLAFEAILACRELGIRVPDQVSICGFDNSEWAHMLSEHITTVEQDMEQVGTQAAELLLAGINAPLASTRQVVVPTRLIVGDTSGQAPGTSDTANVEGATQ